MLVDAETAFLAARATTHAAARGVDIATHRAGCDCGRRPTWCSRCDRDVESWSLTFFDGQFFCGDCLDETGIQQIAESEDQPALAAE